MVGDPLRDLNCAARIHIFGNARRTEAVTTNSFQNPASFRPLLNQLQHTPTIARRPAHGPTYVYRCPFCAKTFNRRTMDVALNANKNRCGYPCPGRMGVYLRSHY